LIFPQANCKKLETSYIISPSPISCTIDNFRIQIGGLFINTTPEITEYIIDKKTYIVETHQSENATDTLHNKIEKLIIRDLRQNLEKFKKNFPENIDETDKI